MSVTIVSTLPKTAPAPAGETTPPASGNENLASSKDFLSLLLGQLAPTTSVTLPTSEELAEDTTESPATETTSTETANLFAALGIIPTDIKPDTRSTPPSSTITADKTTSGTPGLQSVMNEQTRSPVALPPSNATEPLANAPDKAAKFAADQTVITSTENTAGKETSTESTVPVNTALTTLSAPKTNAPLHDTSVTVQTPLRDPNWNQDFSQKIVWLASGEKQSAQITLNPPQMGPIEVSLNVDKGSATAAFTSANAEVREAIETAMPRLREMFASAGIELGQTNVSAESFRQQAEARDGSQSTPRNRADRGILATEAMGVTSTGSYSIRNGNGLVDTFA